jgi:hypothetical protein
LTRCCKRILLNLPYREWASSPVLGKETGWECEMVCKLQGSQQGNNKDVIPLPLEEECMDTLSGNLWHSKLDATWGY